MRKYNYQFQDCYVVMENNLLQIGNAVLARVWDLSENIPIVISLQNKITGKEWFTAENTHDWLNVPEKKYAFYKNILVSEREGEPKITAQPDDDCAVARKHLRVCVRLEYRDCVLNWIHLVYPETGIMRSFIEVSLKEGVCLPEEEQNCTVLDKPHFKEICNDFQDSYPLLPIHCGWKSVSFQDITDDFDNLVECRHGLLNRRERKFLKGNLCFIEDHLAKEGMILIKEGPTPLAYLGGAKYDFFIKGMNLFATGWGFTGKELNKFRSLTTYGSAVVLWTGNEEMALDALHGYHTALHVYHPEKDAFVMSNTWGDMSADGRISEEFLLKELDVASRTGITYYQIDDGWQTGTTCNSVLANGAGDMGYYNYNPEFWSVNKKRLPNGLEPIAKAAKQKGIMLGLWFSPDSINDFENWEKDADTLISLHKTYDIRAFKLDGIQYATKAGEENIFRLLQKVLKGTEGKVLFNMDVTAGIRSGYFGKLQYSSLFIENRFTGNFGAYPNYFPHCTLRNIWMLSRYYPTFRLQADFSNVKRNVNLYPNDPLAPAACGMEYAFAVTMFANPLSWMEQTGLDEESVAVLNRMIPTYRKYQGDILGGCVLPIGDEPNGTSWTGFQSVTSDTTGYLLILKERNMENEHCYKLWRLKDRVLKLECILGYGMQECVTTDRFQQAVLELDGEFTYALYRYTVVEEN